MSIGRNREEQEITALLARTLVAKEVLEPMGKIGWSHGTPPPPVADGQPAASEGAPTLPPAQPTGQPVPAPAPESSVKTDPPVVDLTALYESLRDPETGLIGKKYKTVEDAIKGSVHLVQMAKQSFTERDEALRQLREVEQRGQTSAAVSSPAVPTTNPAVDASRASVAQAQADLDKVLAKIDENDGVLGGELAREYSEANNRLAVATAQASMLEARDVLSAKDVAEKAEWSRVDQYMAEKYPNSTRFSEEVALNMESDPLLLSAVKALLAQNTFDAKRQATELAWTAFERSHGAQLSAEERKTAEEKEADLAAREQVRQEQLAKARKDAGIVTGSAGGSGTHENTNAAGASREELEHLRARMRAEGDTPGSAAAAAYRRAIIPLDPTIFGPQ